MKVLILCTGNSCRSQMAHGFLKSFDPELMVFSAGTIPAEKVNHKAVEVIADPNLMAFSFGILFLFPHKQIRSIVNIYSPNYINIIH